MSRSVSSQTPMSERAVIFVIAAVQFVNILDFVMVMPLGPDLAAALGIPQSQLGWLGGSYTAAAAVAGIAGSFFLERFDRRIALAAAMAGLVVATALGGFAQGETTLILSRILAGLFGGPATSLSFSIIGDVIPSERRGRAIGTVMTAFSIASILGVPIGLELARLAGWRTPFFGVAGLGAVITVAALRALPPMTRHLESGRGIESISLGAILSRPLVLAAYAMTAMVMSAGFLVIPNISAFVQFNLGYPREGLGFLYLAGGVVSLVTLRYAGRLVDRFGSTRVAIGGAAPIIFVLYFCFMREVAWLPVPLVFMLFMFGMGFRNVAYNTLASRVPALEERARFLSVQSAVQHLASAAGAILSTRLLHETPSRALEGMAEVTGLSIALTIFLPFVMHWVETRVAGKPDTLVELSP